MNAVTAYSAFEGVLAALLHRERTGQGQLVQVNMLDALIAMQMQELTIRTVGGVPQSRGQQIHAHCYIRAPYGIFATADGYLALAFPELGGLADALDAPELAHRDAERDGFAQRTASRPSSPSGSTPSPPATGSPCSASAASGPGRCTPTTICWLTLRSSTTALRQRPAPTEGRSARRLRVLDERQPGRGHPARAHRRQRTVEVLAEAGLPGDEIGQLLADGVIGAR